MIETVAALLLLVTLMAIMAGEARWLVLVVGVLVIAAALVKPIREAWRRKYPRKHRRPHHRPG